MTKILVIGLDCAAPELLFGDERLTHFRRLMGNGCYGRLESVIPPITVPAWMCLATSQDPGSLGVYGFRNRADHSYEGLRFANARSIVEPAIWDQVSRQGGRSNIIGVPPSYPPRRVDGICVGCFLTPDTRRSQYTHPALIQERIAGLVGDYPVDVKGFRTHRKDWLKQQIDSMTHKHFEVVRHFLRRSKWDYFHFVEIGLDRIHHGFWQYQDPRHRLFEAGNPYREVVGDYYRLLDDKVGELLELLDEEAVILVVSDHGAKPLDGGFCVNEWLIRQGWLVLNRYPREVTPFGQLAVDWDRTRVWSEGGYYARVFLNVKGREPRGTIAPQDYEPFRDEVAARLEPSRTTGPSHGNSGLQARTDLSRGPKGGPRPHRPLRGALLALHRIGGPFGAALAGERHRPRRLQSRPTRRLYPQRPRTLAARRSPGSPPAGHGPNPAPAWRLRRARLHAGNPSLHLRPALAGPYFSPGGRTHRFC